MNRLFGRILRILLTATVFGWLAQAKQEEIPIPSIIEADDNEDPAVVEVEDEVPWLGEPVSVSIGKTGESEEANGERFIATKEWQRIKPGQTIPRGLHVRMNLQTGVKEAKLLEEETDVSEKSAKIASAVSIPQEQENEEETGRILRMKNAIEDAMSDLEKEQEDGSQYWKVGDKEGMMNVNKNVYSRDELKHALKKFKTMKDDVQDEKVVEKSKKQNFRTIDELKKEFAELNISMKTDYEILTELYNKYKEDGNTLEEHKNILTDLEYYLHQIDNARDFAQMGGLRLVIRDLNHTDESIRSEAAFVIGSATQSNPKVQVQAIDDGALQTLIRLIATPSSSKLRNRVIYAVSSIVRHFPYAQKKFLQLGGLSALSSVFNQDGIETLKLKCVTLITDLVLEQKYAITEDSADEQKVAQYKEVPIIKFLQEMGWCDLITTLLSSPEHDSREKVLVAMGSLMDHCRTSFTKSLSQLSKLKTEYENLSKTELTEKDEEKYYTGLLHTVDNIMGDLSIKDEL